MLEKLFARIKEEPSMFQGVLQAAIALAVSFGVGLTGDQVGALLAFTAILLAFLTRSQVTPNHIVDQRVETALNTPVPPKE